jgi:Zn-dependent protease
LSPHLNFSIEREIVVDFYLKKIRVEFRWGAILPMAALLLITIVRFGIRDGIAAAMLFFASLAVHEAGHAVAAALTDTEFSAVGFCFKGAYIRRKRAQGGTEVLISSAGPLVNILIALALVGSHGILSWLAQMNVILALVNLLPLAGSDGQRILAEIRAMTQISNHAAG